MRTVAIIMCTLILTSACLGLAFDGANIAGVAIGMGLAGILMVWAVDLQDDRDEN